MYDLQTIKRLNQEAKAKEQQELMQDIKENEAILTNITNDIVKQLTHKLKIDGSIPGIKVA